MREITSIANKVIDYEQSNANVTRVFELYSGTGSYHTIFESDNNIAAKKLATIHNAVVRNFKGSGGVDDIVMRSEFMNFNVLMMIYNGHGGNDGLGNPYGRINIYSVYSIVNAPYFFVGFACELNTPQLESFGPVWIRDGDRTLAFYGSTVTTSTSSDTYFSKHNFDYFKSQTSNIRYSQLTQYSAGKYYNALTNPTRKNEAKKYLFLGDPTVYTFGMNALSGNPVAYIKSRENYNDPKNLVINENEVVEIVRIYNTLGQLVLSEDGRKVSSLDDILKLLNSLSRGTYIVSIKTTENEYVHKYNH